MRPTEASQKRDQQQLSTKGINSCGRASRRRSVISGPQVIKSSNALHHCNDLSETVLMHGMLMVQRRSKMAAACKALEGAMNIEAMALGVSGLLENLPS